MTAGAPPNDSHGEPVDEDRPETDLPERDIHADEGDATAQSLTRVAQGLQSLADELARPMPAGEPAKPVPTVPVPVVPAAGPPAPSELEIDEFVFAQNRPDPAPEPVPVQPEPVVAVEPAPTARLSQPSHLSRRRFAAVA
ncbi:MAG: hypothetical protein ACRDJM_07580, partial [Actinomycetota bacterium]